MILVAVLVLVGVVVLVAMLVLVAVVMLVLLLPARLQPTGLRTRPGAPAHGWAAPTPGWLGAADRRIGLVQTRRGTCTTPAQNRPVPAFTLQSSWCSWPSWLCLWSSWSCLCSASAACLAAATAPRCWPSMFSRATPAARAAVPKMLSMGIWVRRAGPSRAHTQAGTEGQRQGAGQPLQPGGRPEDERRWAVTP
jgi:hypothetical protein